jgi:hypothetical protein
MPYGTDWTPRRWKVTESHDSSIRANIDELIFEGNGSNGDAANNRVIVVESGNVWLSGFVYEASQDFTWRQEAPNNYTVIKREVSGGKTTLTAMAVSRTEPPIALPGGTGGTCWVAEDGGVKARDVGPLGQSFNHNQTLVRGAR